MAEHNEEFNDGIQTASRGQLQYPLNLESQGALRDVFPKLDQELDVPKTFNLISGNVTFAASSNVMVINAAAGVTIATITNGYEGQLLTLIFTDSNVTITDTSTGASNTINLSGSFTSTANDVMQLVNRAGSWREVTRSLN